ncbi:MAG: response regulator [Terriglobia bacterium]
MMKRNLSEQFHLPSSARVLLVDNDEVDLDYHARLLRGQGHTVLACPSYSAGIELAAHGEFDFAMVGQGGPAFEGRSVLERLRQRQPSIPFVVLARAIEAPCYLEAMNLGAADYLEKPVHPAEMKRILREHLETPQPV